MSHHWIKFWPQDWRRDPALRSCGLAARGLWMEMLCIMHQGEPYGHLTINGKPLTVKQLGTNVGIHEREAMRLSSELEDAGVFSRTGSGAIYSRRMVRDRQASDVGRTFGKTGGNPALKVRRTKADNPPSYLEGLTLPVNRIRYPPPQTLEADAEFKKQSPLPPFDCDGVTIRFDDGRPEVAGWYLDDTLERVVAAARIERKNRRADVQSIVSWLADGIDPNTIETAIKRVAGRPNYVPPVGLGYFDRAVREQPRKAAQS